MFTGLVEGLARVERVVPESQGLRITLTPPEDLCAVRVGDSVAINGCCLTAVALGGGHWSFQAGPETLAKTNLGALQVGQRVNVERALPVDGRVGGHFVQGHVDGVALVDHLVPQGEWLTVWFRLPAELARDLVPKGSVAVDGVSLTVVEVERERFSVALIPHTLQATTLGTCQPGATVNIETDILGKYVRKFLQ
ncbi:MAG: riboflavin synthase [Planctomycetaceae bacterium]